MGSGCTSARSLRSSMKSASGGRLVRARVRVRVRVRVRARARTRARVRVRVSSCPRQGQNARE